MGRVVGKIESARQRETLVSCIREPFTPGSEQTGDLAARAGLNCKLADAGEIREFFGFLRQGLLPYR